MKFPKNWLSVLAITLFIGTRLFIWANPPNDFTQIISAYMPYAHLWASGELPYLNQWYEYPPLTIPFFYLPHLIDMATNHQWYHINYSDAYKGILTLVDSGVFILIWTVLRRMKCPKHIFYTSLIYYSLVTAKTNHFIYDSFDLIFAAAILLGLAAPVLWKQRGTFIGWVGFMAAVAIKYVNAPLALPLALSQRFSIKRLIVEGAVATILIWGFPLAFFRSSLLVTLEYHKERGLQIESAPATLVRTIDQWTHSEHVTEVAKAYDIQGPVSNIIMQVFQFAFPLAMLAYIIYVSAYMWQQGKNNTTMVSMWITLGYISLFMMTATVLSTPYLLWHIPLVAMIPTKSLKEKLKLLIPSFVIIVSGMTYFPNIPVGPLPLHVWIGWIKVLGFGLILWQTFQHLPLQRHARRAK